MGIHVSAIYTLLLFLVIHRTTGYLQAQIDININASIHKTDKMYFSLGMDSNLVRLRWQTFDFNSKRLMTLAQGLAPAYLRLMGTDGDRMKFKFNTTDKVNGFFFPTTNFIITAKDWDNINIFCLKAGWRLLFGFNAQIRYKIPSGTSWDPSNAIEILDYSVKKGYNKNLDFELGNEPIAYEHRPGWVPISMKQLAQDFNFLKKVLNGLYTGYFNQSIIVGPDFAVVTKQRVQDFLNNVGDFIHAMTFHQYYGGSNLKYKENYTDPDILDSYVTFVKMIKSCVASSSKPKIKIWNGETSSTVDPSGTGLEESFAAVFMLMDKYGTSASLGLDLVVRQTFYGFWFALVNAKLQPTPNYWVSLYYKKLVGQSVLNVTTILSGANNTPRRLRMYGHCTQDSNMYPAKSGSITVYAMNLFDEDIILSSTTEVHQYLFTSSSLASKDIYLNGEKLAMVSDTAFPDITPTIFIPNEQILLPPKSVVYYVLPNVKAPACVL